MPRTNGKGSGGLMIRVLIVLALIAAGAQAQALDSNGRGDNKRIASPDEAVERAVSQINKRYKGRVLSATPIKGPGGYTVRVKILSNGVIKVLTVDPGKD